MTTPDTWDVINDILNSLRLAVVQAALDSPDKEDVLAQIYKTVEDYAVNRYGDD